MFIVKWKDPKTVVWFFLPRYLVLYLDKYLLSRYVRGVFRTLENTFDRTFFTKIGLRFIFYENRAKVLH